ncbi:MAG TPA: hypothetical protein ENK39_02420 [Epsilonproteobacteria bacterium]|nr:hypothetical protein [Campylobacterota bacterium]
MGLLKASILFILFTTSLVFSATLELTTKYGQTGGIVAPVNQTSNIVNGRTICPTNPTIGCDFGTDPGYNNGGTVADPTDDSYNGDLVIRTNDSFQAIAAWNWSGVAGGADEEVTLTSTLPVAPDGGKYYKWDTLPGFCGTGSSISADGQTMTCVRKDFDKNDVGTYAEDLIFNVTVKGVAPSGVQPGPISFTAVTPNAPTRTDDTEGVSLTVTAAPRWNLQKLYYRTKTGHTLPDGTKGWLLEYVYSVEADEVNGETDNASALVGNESMGNPATFSWTDDLSGISPNAQLVDCTTKGRRDQKDGYVGSTNPLSFSGPGSIYGTTKGERKIDQLADEQQITCTQTGSSVAVTLSGVDGTLSNYPKYDYAGRPLPVNRGIAALGTINVFVPLDDVKDNVAANGNTGERQTKNHFTDFNPVTPTGNANFVGAGESEKDNDKYVTLYYTKGSFDKYYRGEKNSVWTYPGGETIYRGGSGVVNAGYEFSTQLTSSNTGGTDFTEETICDVVDAYRLDIQDIADNVTYDKIKTPYSGGYIQGAINYGFSVKTGDLVNGKPVGQEPFIVEYASTYTDKSWLPSQGGDQTAQHGDKVVAECSDSSTVWHSSVAAAKADATGIGAVTKVRIRLRPGYVYPPGPTTYMWLNHKIRTNHLATGDYPLSGQALQNGDEIVNYAAQSFNGNALSVSTYVPNEYPLPHSGRLGDRVTFVGAKVRVIKTGNKTSVSPGDDIDFNLAVSFTNDTGLTDSGPVRIVDFLPKGVTYQGGSVQAPYAEPTQGTCADVSDISNTSNPCVDGENQVLIWDLGTRNVNEELADIHYTALIGITAKAGTNRNIAKIESPNDGSAITQRKSDVGFSISVPSSINIVKNTVENPAYPSERERITTPENIDFSIDLRNGSPVNITDLDVIDVLPFVGDGADGAIAFSSSTLKRKVPTTYHGSMQFNKIKLISHPGSTDVCDVSANGGVKYYYTNETPSTVNLAPTVGVANSIGGASSIWCEGNENGPNGCTIASSGFTFSDNTEVTAVRASGPSMESGAICQLQIAIEVNNNLEGDNYSNSAGSSASGITLPVASNSVTAPIVGSSLGDKVWYDQNQDGIQDTNEAGMAGITVKLLDAAGNPVKDPSNPTQDYVVVTDSNGFYSFDKLVQGDYKVAFVTPTGYLASPKAQGADTTVDSNIDSTGTTDVISLGKGEDNPTVDAGFYTPIISGNIFNDGDGDANVNGAAIPTPDGVQLYANLIDNAGNVIASTPIAADGTYVFDGEDGIRINTDYVVSLSTTQGTVGQAKPAANLPANWNHTGQNLNASTGTGKDGTDNDGEITVNVGTVNVPKVDFGINKKPEANNITETSQVNPGGNTAVPVSAVTLSAAVSDNEDGTPTTVTIKTLPTNGTLFYNGTPVVAGTPILNFDPTLLTVNPDSGNQNIIFTYTVTDVAGVESDVATVSIPFFVVLPTAEDDYKSNPNSGTQTNLNILTNDTNGSYQLDPNTVKFSENNSTTLVVAGEGTWTVDNVGNVTFMPLPTFTGDPTPVPYTVQDTEGNVVTATITIDYPQTAPVSTDNNKTGTIINTSNGPVQQPVTFNAITENSGSGIDSDPENDLNVSSFIFTSGLPGSTVAADGKSITVPGEGVWTEDGAGNVTFTPEVGFLGNPTPVKYEVSDNTGLVSNESTLTVVYPEVRKISGNVGIDITDDNLTDRAPLVPVEMVLYDENGTELARTFTDANGDYSFNVIPGTYGVEEINPPNVEDAIDRDSNVTDDGQPDGTNDSHITQIDANTQDSPNNDFVDKPVLGNVKGIVFKDDNSDGNFTGAESVKYPSIDIKVTDVYGVEHLLTTDATGGYDLTGLPVGPATVSVDTADPDLPEGATPTTSIVETVDIPANAYVVKDFGFNVPPITDSDPASLASCAKPSSITWEGSTVSSSSVWHDMAANSNVGTAKTFTTVGGKSIAVSMYVTDTNNQFNNIDAGSYEVNTSTNSNYAQNGVFGQPYLTLYLGKQDNNSTDEPGALLPSGSEASLTVDFNESVLLDNWRIRDLDSGDVRNGDGGWDWQDAVKMEAYDENGNLVPLLASIGSGTNLTTTNGFYHTDGVTDPSVLQGTGTDANSATGHLIYSSNGVPIRKLVIIHQAGPDILNQTRSALALSGFAVCVPIHISGTIYNDGNGSTVDGTPIGDIDGTALYANLVDNTGTVIDTVEINTTTGEYLFDKHINPDSNYTVVLSTEQMTVGVPQSAPVLPNNWNYSSENNTSTAPDGVLNGIVQVEVADESVPLVDFGINEKPVATDVVDPPVLNPGGNVGVLVQTASVANLTDREDTSPKTLTLVTLPANAEILYDGVAVVPGVAITNFDFSKLTVNPDDGNQTVIFDYTVTDADGIESEPATVTMPFVEVTLSGNIFNDGDGDGNVNGTPISTPAGTQLYATLLDVNGTVLASTPIAADGTYGFNGADGVSPDHNYSVVVSTNANATTSTLPLNWNNTGENLNDTNATGNDGLVDGMITVSTLGLTVVTPEIPLVDFGINERPVALDTNETTQLNPGTNTQVQVPTLNVSDSEDGTPSTITLKTLPNNATLYYNNVPVTVGQVINNYDPTKLTVDPDNGDQVVSFDYTTTDADGIESEIATVTMPFTGLKISGNVFNDGDGNGNVNGTPISAPASTQLYATLLDGTGTILATTAIAIDGTYSFDGMDGIIPNSEYTVVISSNQNATSSTLPSNWNNTGENLNASGTGNDGTVDGKINVSVTTADVPQVDFGINLKPVATDVSENTQQNPGSDTEVDVPDLNVSDLEDGTPTTITIESIPSNAILYYDGGVVDANTTIVNFDQSLLTVDPIDGDQIVIFDYTTTDADGIKSDPATVTMPFTGLTISGNIYNDGDGDNDVFGESISSPDGVQLYATLLSSDGGILASVVIDENGTYSFDGSVGVNADTNYTIVLSTAENATFSTLPENWNSTGENLNDSGTGNDGTPDGLLNVSVSTTDVPLIDFGINKKPLAIDVNEIAQLNPGADITVPVPELNVTDSEDGTPMIVTISTVPTNAILYYDGIEVSDGTVIADYNASLLVVDPDNGDQNVTFEYTTTDADGIESEPATVSMPFTQLIISGNVFNDGNGNDNVDGTGISAPDNEPLYATLLADDGTVLASTLIADDGSYSFDGTDGVAPDHNYSIVLSTEEDATVSALPVNWNNTGENLNDSNATGNDGDKDGMIQVSITDTNVPHVDFGINVKPVAEDTNSTLQLNPSGNTQYQVPALNITDNEDGQPMIVTITTLPDPDTMGILYYDGVPVVEGEPIVNFDPTKLTIDPVNGNPVVVFNYTTTDAEGIESDQATVTMPFKGDIYVGNRVWMDENGNGAQDDGEEPKAGVTVKLYSEAGTLIATAVTDENGEYIFKVAEPGNYYLEFDENYSYTAHCPDCNESVDSDVDNTTNKTPVFSLDFGDNDMTHDAGITPTAHIGDYFWIDSNQNGLQDPEEEPVVGGTVALFDADGNPVEDVNGNHILTTNDQGIYGWTDEQGVFHTGFDVDPDETYQVEFTIPNQGYAGYVFENGTNTYRRSVSVVAGENIVTVDAPINCGCANVSTDSSDALGLLGMLAMMLMTLMTALFFVKKEEYRV